MSATRSGAHPRSTRRGGCGSIVPGVLTPTAPLDRRELSAYIRRLGDRWPLELAVLGGARVHDQADPPAPPQRERGPEYVLVLVSGLYDGVPWLERVHQAASLWDADVMGDPVDVHCYTPVELERRRQTLKLVQDALATGVDLLTPA
jgi:hypothetical protein